MICKICNGQSIYPCMFCGKKIKKQKKTVREIERKIFLKGIKNGLKKFNMDTTGSENVDNSVIKTIGDWK